MIIRKQRGLTLIGFIFVLALGIFFAYTGMKIIPIYLEYNALISALKTVENTPGAAEMDPGRIRNMIMNSLWVSYASDSIKRENIRISRNDGVRIRVVYEVRKSWIGNLDLIAHFDKSVALRS
jgi:hypothetical protein